MMSLVKLSINIKEVWQKKKKGQKERADVLYQSYNGLTSHFEICIDVIN
jgi:hypothetical protein